MTDKPRLVPAAAEPEPPESEPVIAVPRDLFAAATTAIGTIPIATAGGQVARIFLAMQQLLAAATE